MFSFIVVPLLKKASSRRDTITFISHKPVNLGDRTICGFHVFICKCELYRMHCCIEVCPDKKDEEEPRLLRTWNAPGRP